MTYWKAKTKTGKVVYIRPPHYFTQRDIDRITANVLEKRLRDAAPGAGDAEIALWIRFLIFVLDDLSERMLDTILAPVGLASFSDDVVAAIKKAVQNVVNNLTDYLEKARGPIGIPGGGVF